MPRPMQMHLHGTVRDAEDLGDLGDRTILDVEEQHARTLLQRELSKGGSQVDIGGWELFPLWCFTFEGGSEPIASRGSDRQADRDAAYPRLRPLVPRHLPPMRQ